jgi:hypothetical protein
MYCFFRGIKIHPSNFFAIIIVVVHSCPGDARADGLGGLKRRGWLKCSQKRKEMSNKDITENLSICCFDFCLSVFGDRTARLWNYG